MKLASILLGFPLLTFGCQHTPLANLRDMYGLELLKKFQTNRSVTGFMYNHAIVHDDLEAFKIFFTYGARGVIYEDVRLSQADRNGAEPIYFYPLHLAAQYGAMNVTHFCLENKANVNEQTQSDLPQFDKNTPAHIAVMYSKHEALAALLSWGDFDLKSKNGMGKTVEELAIGKDDPASLAIINEAKLKKVQ